MREKWALEDAERAAKVKAVISKKDQASRLETAIQIQVDYLQTNNHDNKRFIRPFGIYSSCISASFF